MKSNRYVPQLNLQKRIALTMIFLVVLTTVFLGTTIYRFSKKTIENNYQNAHLNNLAVSSQLMDIYLEKIIEEGRMLLEDENFVEIMETESNSSNYFSSLNQLAIDKALNDISSHNFLINGLMVVNDVGNWRYYSKSKVYSGYLNHYYTTDDILLEPWVEVAKNHLGKEVFYSYDVLLKDEAEDGFCYVKNLINPHTQESFGYLVVSIDKRIWKEIFSKDNEGYTTNRYMVTLPGKNVNEDQIVYFTGGREEEERILEASHVVESGTYLLSTFRNKTTGWSIMNVITKEELEEDSEYIKMILIIGITIMTVISIGAATVISSRITKPLDVLASSMSMVEVGQLKVETEFDDSEVGKIGQKFKSLINNNLELRENLLHLAIQEKEAQLLLLQSQINPHFLYNTLDSLYFMALIEQADDIAEMVQALSNIFKRSLNNGDKLITLSEEVEHMRDYMKIQNFRFGNRYSLHIQVEEGMEHVEILTFILQPILENAVYHGLEPTCEEGNVYFEAYSRGAHWFFRIQDDGVGIDDVGVIDSGYGIRNIKERIHLYYGATSSVTIESEIGVGTIVNISLPSSEESVLKARELRG